MIHKMGREVASPPIGLPLVNLTLNQVPLTIDNYIVTLIADNSTINKQIKEKK